MTAKHLQQSEDLSGQYPILTGRCPLTGCYLKPCTVFSCIFLFRLKEQQINIGRIDLHSGKATSGELTFRRNSLLPFGWLVVGGSTITSFEVLKGYNNMMPYVK